ncbi:MAG: DNA repair protein RecN [Acetivibrio sp.]
MLVNLHVKNLAIIDEVDIDFGNNLNILTGETGAGKSILIDSINIALGQKVSTDMIRKGEEQALVELTFYIEEEQTLEKLRALDIPVEDQTVIVSRRIRNGRSISKVNGMSVTTTILKELAGLLIDIHGQHEHQSLLYKSKHLEILDRFGKGEASKLLKEIKESFLSYVKCKKELEEAALPEEDRLREISFIQYEKKEIEEARFKKGEDEAMEALYKKMSNAGAITDGLSGIYQITGGEDSVSDAIGRGLRILSRILELDDSLKEFEEQLLNVDSLLNDFNREIADYMSDYEFDMSEFANVEERLNRIYSLKAKYGSSFEQIEEYYHNLEEKLNRYEDYDLYIQKKKEALSIEEKNLEKQSEKVSKIRKANAVILEKKITEALIELNFLDVRFKIDFRRLEDFTSKGWDEIEFLISTNPGEDLRPLGKVASGGELSRIMLAIKSVLADKDEVDTLIFDEIDAGISGRTAQKVSERLSLMAKTHQVISITHLPQIASMADEHYIIEKSTDGKTTKTNIEHLSFEKSVVELARILGGAEITEAVLASAKEMKELAANIKK